jgi:hypothetical protein
VKLTIHLLLVSLLKAHGVLPPLLHTWCDYDVPGMILLLDLKGAMRLDHSEDMSVRVSPCTDYDLNALTPVMWKLCPYKMCVFLRLVTKMSDRFLEYESILNFA